MLTPLTQQNRTANMLHSKHKAIQLLKMDSVVTGPIMAHASVDAEHMLDLQLGQNGKTTLTLDIVDKILSYIHIGFENIVIKVLGNGFTPEEKEYLLEHRRSPAVFFRRLTADTSRLMAGIMQDATILGGLQAARYFMPSIDGTNHPWDFFCDGTVNAICNMVLTLATIGVKFENATQYSFQMLRDVDIYMSLLSGEVCRDRSTQTVRLCWCPKQKALSAAYSYQKSAIKSFISGFTAFSTRRPRDNKAWVFETLSQNVCRHTLLRRHKLLDTPVWSYNSAFCSLDPTQVEEENCEVVKFEGTGPSDDHGTNLLRKEEYMDNFRYRNKHGCINRWSLYKNEWLTDADDDVHDGGRYRERTGFREFRDQLILDHWMRQKLKLILQHEGELQTHVDPALGGNFGNDRSIEEQFSIGVTAVKNFISPQLEGSGSLSP